LYANNGPRFDLTLFGLSAAIDTGLAAGFSQPLADAINLAFEIRLPISDPPFLPDCFLLLNDLSFIEQKWQPSLPLFFS
jgi:hypothetical protein